MLIYPADVIREIEGARKFGIDVEITRIDFNAIMERMRRTVEEGRGHLRGVIESAENLDLYEGEGRFIGEYTVEVNKEVIRGRKIFIASGARPTVPPVIEAVHSGGIVQAVVLCRQGASPDMVLW